MEDQRPALTVPETAARLDMTPDGVYKLIQRGKLGAVRPSARKTRVPEAELNRYIEMQQAAVAQARRPVTARDIKVLREAFKDETGMRPEEWVSAWKNDEIEDTAANMRLLVHACALREANGEAPARQPQKEPWAAAALHMKRWPG